MLNTVAKYTNVYLSKSSNMLPKNIPLPVTSIKHSSNSMPATHINSPLQPRKIRACPDCTTKTRDLGSARKASRRYRIRGIKNIHRTIPKLLAIVPSNGTPLSEHPRCIKRAEYQKRLARIGGNPADDLNSRWSAGRTINLINKHKWQLARRHRRSVRAPSVQRLEQHKNSFLRNKFCSRVYPAAASL